MLLKACWFHKHDTYRTVSVCAFEQYTDQQTVIRDCQQFLSPFLQVLPLTREAVVPVEVEIEMIAQPASM